MANIFDELRECALKKIHSKRNRHTNEETEESDHFQ